MSPQAEGHRVRFAVIGCGALAQGTHIPHLARSERAELHTCCDVSDEALETCRRKWDVRRLRTDWRDAVADEEVDAICLATTERLRLPVIAAAAEAGKPVYVEKPLARELEEMYEIQRVVRGAGIPFCVGHNRRSSPAVLEARGIFRRHMTDPQPCPWRWDREGAGRPALAEDGTAAMAVRINDDWYSWKGWVFDPADAPHGPMVFEMTHYTDLCNWFLAAEPKEVVAVETGMLLHAVIIRYAGGELATITMCANGTFGYPKELYEAMGNGGIVVVDHMVELRTAGIAGAPAVKTYPLENDPYGDVGREGGLHGWLAKRRRACEEAAARGEPTRVLAAGPDKGHARHLERFVEQILGRGGEVCGVDDAVLATRVAFAAVRSAKQRRAVALEEV